MYLGKSTILIIIAIFSNIQYFYLIFSNILGGFDTALAAARYFIFYFMNQLSINSVINLVSYLM